MFNKKILALAVLAFTLSACGGKVKKDQVDLTNQTQTEQPSQDVQPFNTVDSATAADQINQQTQADIDQVEVSDRVFFDTNKSNLSDDAKKILNTQADWLKSDQSIKVVLEGHCDDRGTREYNLALGEKRANAAKQYLVSQGIDGSRIRTISYGKERPAFVGSGEEIWAKNRRAVTVIEEK